MTTEFRPLRVRQHRFPEVQLGPGGLVVTTRCPDFGKVKLEVWLATHGRLLKTGM